MDLPSDVLVDILLRLPVESLRSFRRVCKTWLNTIESRSFIRQHTLSLITGNNHVVHRVPQLMCLAQETSLSDGERITSATLQSLRYDGGTALTTGEFAFPHLTTSNFPSNYMISFVFYNLFCVVWINGDCLLINPLLKQVLTLPTDNIQQLDVTEKYGRNAEVRLVGWYGMGFDDISNTYKIVRVSWIIVNERQGFSVLRYLVHILELGTNSWREIPSSLPPYVSINWLYSLCAYGDMHWQTLSARAGHDDHIISFDFKKEEFHPTPTPPTLRTNEDSSLHLVSLRGSMAMVETFPLAEGGMKVEIWVMKDYAKKEWAREYSINVDMRPKFKPQYATEWEHGISFNDQHMYSESKVTRLFLDLRNASVNTSICPVETKFCVNVRSYTGSLISLSDFATLGDSTDEPSS